MYDSSLAEAKMSSGKSKAKEHSAAMVDGTLTLWRQGDLNILMKEVKVYILEKK